MCIIYNLASCKRGTVNATTGYTFWSFWDMHSAGHLVMCLGENNGHDGRHIDEFDGVHGGNGIGQRNPGGGMLLEFCQEKELSVSNTWLNR